MKLRKLFSLLLVAALCVGFTACDDDETSGSVVGKWQSGTIVPVVESSNPAVKAAVSLVVQGLIDDINLSPFTIDLKDDGKCILTMEGGEPEQGTYAYSGNELTITGDFSLLVLAGGAQSLTFGTSFSGSSLVLEVNVKPLIGSIIESMFPDFYSSITKLAMAITLTPVS